MHDPTPHPPSINPYLRNPDEVAGAASYHPHDPVWVWPPLAGGWRPGVVDAASDLAVRVTHLHTGGGTGVDTLLPQQVMPRDPGQLVNARSGGGALPSRPRATSAVPA